MSELGAVIFVCRDKHMKEFDEVFVDKTKYGTKLKTSDYKECGKYPIIDQGQETIAGYTDAEDGVFKEVPVIIFGDHTRVIKYVDKPFFLGADGVKVLRSKYLDANYRYLFYALLNLKIPNTGYNRHFKWLKEAKIQYPTLKQQEKVVGILDKIEEVMAARNKQLNALEDLIQARFVELFGEPILNPKEWKIVTIGDIALDVRYGTSRPAVEGGKYPYLRMNNLTIDGHLDLTDLKYIDIPEEELEKCVVRKGDILFNRTNSLELVGKTAVFDLCEDMVIAGYIIRVRLNNKMILPEIFSQYMNHKTLKKILRGMAKGAVNQANINAKELQSIKIYVPNMKLQDEFVTFVNQVHKSKVEIQQALEKTQLLFDSLMQQYFG